MSAEGAETFYQGVEKIPTGTRRTLGRQTRMLAAVDRENLSPRHKAIIRAGIIKYADGDGIFFPDQGDWADVAGCSRKLVIAAVAEAVGSGLLRKTNRVFTTTGKKGTSVYFLSPELWSKDPEAVHKSAETRLSALSNRVSKTTHGPCVENDTTEGVVTFGNTYTRDERVEPVVFDDELLSLDERSESDYPTTYSFQSKPTLQDPTKTNLVGALPESATTWPRFARVNKPGFTRDPYLTVYMESAGAARLFQDDGYSIEYRCVGASSEPMIWDRPIPGRKLVAA
jgi:hypothetical protein